MTEWINPNGKSQARYLPRIGEPCLFTHEGKVYYGEHTGGCFRTGQGDTAKLFGTWACMWMPIPEAPETKPSVPDGFVWPECPKRRQSHVLFDDGYEEGWAACVATIKAMTNTTPEAKPWP